MSIPVNLPERNSPAERDAFLPLQARLPGLFRDVFLARRAPRTVVVFPGLSLDPQVLATVAGVRHYEERMLGMLMLLRMPATRVVFLTSEPIPSTVIDYYLSLLSGVPSGHALARLTLLSAHDASASSLTRKLLERPRLLARVRQAIGDPARAHLSVFNATGDEVSLAVALGIPMYACDPALAHWGSKSGLQRAVLKLNEGFSGEGNATVNLSGFGPSLGAEALWAALPERLQPEAQDLDVGTYAALSRRHGGIVEAWIEGEDKRSPSVQLRINPLGEVALISTHEQVLGGRTGQVFSGQPLSGRSGLRVRPACDGPAGRRRAARPGSAGPLFGRLCQRALGPRLETTWYIRTTAAWCRRT